MPTLCSQNLDQVAIQESFYNFVELVRVYAKKLSNRQHKLPSVLPNWVLAKILKLFSIIQIYIIISKSQVSFIEVFYSSQYDEALSAFQGPWHILRYFNRVQLIGSQFTARSFWSRICVKSPLFLSTDQITDDDSLSSKIDQVAIQESFYNLRGVSESLCQKTF